MKSEPKINTSFQDIKEKLESEKIVDKTPDELLNYIAVLGLIIAELATKQNQYKLDRKSGPEQKKFLNQLRMNAAYWMVKAAYDEKQELTLENVQRIRDEIEHKFNNENNIDIDDIPSYIEDKKLQKAIKDMKKWLKIF